MKKNHLNENMCSTCGGNCCQRLPGIMFPEDFETINKKIIMDLLNTGNYSIDCWEGEIENPYWIRPATIKGKGKLIDKSWGGICVFWSSTGCRFDKDLRPYGCRMLEPREYGEECKIHNAGKLEAAKAWEPFKDIFEEILGNV